MCGDEDESVFYWSAFEQEPVNKYLLCISVHCTCYGCDG